MTMSGLTRPRHPEVLRRISSRPAPNEEILRRTSYTRRVNLSDPPAAAPLVILRYAEGPLVRHAPGEWNERSFGVPHTPAAGLCLVRQTTSPTVAPLSSRTG